MLMLLTASSLRILGWRGKDDAKYYFICAFLTDAMIAMGVAATYGEQILSMIGG
jgi:hypothetical protein